MLAHVGYGHDVGVTVTVRSMHHVSGAACLGQVHSVPCRSPHGFRERVIKFTRALSRLLVPTRSPLKYIEEIMYWITDKASVDALKLGTNIHRPVGGDSDRNSNHAIVELTSSAHDHQRPIYPQLFEYGQVLSPLITATC